MSICALPTAVMVFGVSSLSTISVEASDPSQCSISFVYVSMPPRSDPSSVSRSDPALER